MTELIRGIRQTEKSARLAKLRQYVLQVDPAATKPEIRKAVETLFKVSVIGVNTQRYLGKWKRVTNRAGRRPTWKKAIVTLAEGQQIELK